MEERALMEGEVSEAYSKTDTAEHCYGQGAETWGGSVRSDEVVQRNARGGELCTGWLCEQYAERETQVVSGSVGSKEGVKDRVTSRLRRVLSSIASSRFRVAIRSPVLAFKG